MCRQWIAIICRSEIIFRERAIVWRSSSKDRVGAEVVRAATAIVTMSAWNARFDSNTVAKLDIFDGGTDLNDDSSALVPKSDWRCEYKIADPSSLPVVDVAHADPGLSDLNDHIVRVLDLRTGYILNANIFKSSKHKSRV
jgi:hypothetical protein